MPCIFCSPLSTCGIASSEHSPAMFCRAKVRIVDICYIYFTRSPRRLPPRQKPRLVCDQRSKIAQSITLARTDFVPAKFCRGGCSRMTARSTLSFWLWTIGVRPLSTRDRQQSRIRVEDVFSSNTCPGRNSSPPYIIVHPQTVSDLCSR